MNKAWRSVLSVLLAIALVLPLAPFASAAETEPVYATSVTVAPSSTDNVYYRAGQTNSVKLNATVTPSDYSGTITWSSSGSSLSKASGTGKSLTLTVLGTGATTVTATVNTAAGQTTSNSYTVNVLADSVQSTTVSLSKSSIQVGDTARATATATYHLGTDSSPSSVNYASSDPSVASVNASSGVITGKSEGTTRITATIGGVTSSQKTLTVTAPSANITDTATVGTDLLLREVSTRLAAQFTNAYAYPSGNARITFSIPSSSTVYGALYDSTGAAITDDPYDFSELESMYLRPVADGDFKFTIITTDGGRRLETTVAITISTPTRYIRVPIDGSADYGFSAASADANGRTGAQLIRDAIGTSYGSIRFASILSGENVGTLYTSSNIMDAGNRVGSRTVVNAADVGSLYFTPSRTGTYRIAYTAYSGANASGTVLCTGELSLAVDAASLNVTVNLDSTRAYTFSSTPSSASSSAAAQLRDVIDEALGRSAWGYIKFDGADQVSASAAGVLHENSSTERAIRTRDYISRSDISDLYFVPARVGAYEVGYGVYVDTTSTSPIATGTLRISVSTVLTGTADITYTTSVGSKISLKESDFVDFFENKLGSRYYLSSVVFTDYSGGGTFSHGSTAFVPYNSADYYSSSYTGTLPANARYLDQLSFTAPAESGFTAVEFTCYGGTSSSATGTTRSGMLYIFYTANDVPAVTYSAYNVASVALRETDFAASYKTATKTTAANPRFSIRFLDIPSSGMLYKNLSTSNRTTLTSNNIGNHTFTVGATSATNSVDTLTFVPNTRATGTETIPYIVYDSEGAQLYTGALNFKHTVDRAVSVSGDGLGFSLTDFYSAGDSDPVLYVTFPAPTSGRLYVNTGTRYVTPAEDTKFYTISNAYGDYPITSVLYAPKYGQTSPVTLLCTTHRRSGATYEDSIIVNPVSKTASSNFSDVSGNLSWAVNSIDFASKLGVVGGTGGNPPKFSPLNTMKRCDLILILYRLAGSPAVTGTTPYTDLPAATTSYGREINDSALWAYRNNILSGVVTGTLYNPNASLLRQDFAQFVYNYTNAMGVSTINSGNLRLYSDASQVSSYALAGVTWAVANGYFTSTSGGMTIEPQRAATRAEISTLLHRYLTY